LWTKAIVRNSSRPVSPRPDCDWSRTRARTWKTETRQKRKHARGKTTPSSTKSRGTGHW
jgi:hypothetical protein